MAKNTGQGHRVGEVKERSQVYNPQNKTWVKRDAENGRFTETKDSGKPFKGVRKEK